MTAVRACRVHGTPLREIGDRLWCDACGREVLRWLADNGRGVVIECSRSTPADAMQPKGPESYETRRKKSEAQRARRERERAAREATA